MIPRRLALRNFLSYRACEVDFTGLQLATLAGRNGDGKSALLDAITWALWGEARGRVEDDRIHHGQDEMRVELDFEVDGARYRVIRKRTRGRSGALDLFHLDERGAPRPISGGTNRETQAELTRRLHMDHQTFVNSVFLVQGRSNEFTTQTPSGRKQVLRKVLGLDRYEELSARARELRRDREAEADAEERLIEGAQDELAEAENVQKAIERIEGERKAERARLAEEEKELAELRVAASEHEGRAKAVAEGAERLERRIEDVERRTQAIAALEADRAAVAETLERTADIEAAWEDLRAAREEERDLAALADRDADGERAIAAAERAIAEERSRLETRLHGLEEDREEALALVATLPDLRAEEDSLAGERERLVGLDAEIERAREAAGEAGQLQADRSGEAGGYRSQAQTLKDHEATLAKAEGEPLCPVCRKPLTAAEVRATVAQFKEERRRLGERFEKAQAAVTEAQEAAAAHEDRARTFQRQRTDLDARLREAEQALGAKLERARRAEDALPALEDDRGALGRRLEGEDFAVEAREALAAALAQRDALGYARERHEAVRGRVAALGRADAAWNELTQAREKARGLGERIAENQAELAREASEREAAREALAEARAALEASRDVAPRLREVEAAVAARGDRLRALDQDFGRFTERRDELDRRAAEVAEAQDRHAAARDAAQLAGELHRAFGRDGIQAMLIEQSLPELERIANGLLEQLTEGRGFTQVKLSTQRESGAGKSAKTVETLDIRISDDLGTRDYEMYSGGEKFRVDFALRIALSRLLAARSGASLPTLIIDEGFGSQDEEGRDRLVAAINAISPEFRLILLVTHIEDLRERFDRQIRVTKDPERGSQAVVA